MQIWQCSALLHIRISHSIVYRMHCERIVKSTKHIKSSYKCEIKCYIVSSVQKKQTLSKSMWLLWNPRLFAPHSTEFQMEVFSFRVSFYPIMKTWIQMLDYYTTLNKISEPTHKPTHRHCVTHNWQKLTPEKKDVNVGNYMTVMKCIWGNLVVEIKSPRREKNVCVPLEPKWVR